MFSEACVSHSVHGREGEGVPTTASASYKGVPTRGGFVVRGLYGV